MHDITASAHLGRSVNEVIPELFPVLEPFLRRALDGEAIFGLEFVQPPKGSREFVQTMVASYQPVRDEAGDILGISVALTDITQLKRSEAALTQSEDHYRHMMKLSPHVPWILNSSGEVIDASSRWEEITGQSFEQAIGNGWLNALHPEDVPHTIETIRDSLRTGLPIDMQYRIRRPGQEWKWMRSRGSPRFSSSGQIVSIYGVVEELGENHETAEELVRCEAELRAAINLVPIGMVIADGSDGTVIMVNPSAKATFGKGLFPGQKLAEYGLMGILSIDGRALAPNEHPLALAIQRGKGTESSPFLLRQPDGRNAKIALSSRPIRSDEGKLVGGLLTVRTSETDWHSTVIE